MSHLMLLLGGALLTGPVQAAEALDEAAKNATTCLRDRDCARDKVCEGGRCVVENAHAVAPQGSIALHWLPAFPLTGSTLLFAEPVQNFGLDWSPTMGAVARYHLELSFSVLGSARGVRLSPLGFGFAIPVAEAGDWSFSVEPILSVLQPMLNTQNGIGLFTVSSGLEARLNVRYKRLYIGLSPLGCDVRFFGLSYDASQAVVTFDAAIDYRLHVLVGLNY